MNDDTPNDVGPAAEIIIRPARAEDMAAICQAVRRARLDTTGLNWRRFQVAVNGKGQMVGFCQVRHYAGVKELGSLYVRKASRRQGIGAALVNACLAGMAPPVHQECVEDRQNYYESFDFRRIPLGQAPLALRFKSLAGNVVVRLFLHKRIIVMRWNGAKGLD